MSNPQFYLYRASGEQGDILNISHKPELDLNFYAKTYGFTSLEILSPKIPIAKALAMLSNSSFKVNYPPSALRPNKSPYAFKPGTCLTAEKIKSNKGENNLPGRFPGPGEYEVSRVHQFLAGRILLWEEIKARVDYGSQLALEDPLASVPGPASGLLDHRWPLLDILQVLYLTGSARLMPGISYTANGGLVCNRCGQDKAIIRVGCPDCGEECYQCEECLSMGASRTCTPLWAFPGDCAQVVVGKHASAENHLELEKVTKDASEITIAGPGKLIRAQLSFPLTQAQRAAAKQVLETVVSEQGLRVLVWAACGAGKTEVSFGAIAYTLRKGGKVLFAIPRRDVVRELEPRLKQAFPDIKIISLYGGSEDKYVEGELVLATTHQVIRYCRNFDLVILDEVDAFPYRDSAMLHFAVERARRPEGKLVLMTATPEEKLLEEARSVGGGTVLVTIPARHHGFPLPEPEIVVDKKIRVPRAGSISLPKQVLELIYSSVVADGCQLFLFVPRVALAQRVAEYLREAPAAEPYGPEWSAEPYRQGWSSEPYRLDWGRGIHFVHARDPHRDRKIQAFKDRKFPVLVSTSIMERGITVSRCNVLVLMANRDQVFDAGTLVQMAGRAGRTTDYPEGRVWFVGDGISPAMKIAVQKIREMNTEAQRRGYLVRQDLVWW